MKFYYPVKLFLGGLILNLIIIMYGFFIVYTISFTEGHSKFYVILYLIFVLVILWYFLRAINNYSNRFIEVTQNAITFVGKHSTNVIKKTDLQFIIEANHQQLLKIYNVIHIFERNNRYFYVTNEMNHYKQFKELLKNQYGDFYITREKTINGFPTITPSLLLKDSDYNKFF